MAEIFKRIDLCRNWQFRQADDDEDEEKGSAWMPVDRVPTNVHLDLLANGKIKDPYLDYNELSCEWVAEKSWVYKTILPDLDDHDLRKAQEDEHKPFISLVLEGLDTFAKVRLNGTVIHQNDNMFIPYRIDITKSCSHGTGKENVLEIEFDSAARRAREIKDAHPEHKWVGYNGDMARLAARKAQYHWGWDWGPILNTCGPWRPVYLEIHQARISDLRVDYKLLGHNLADAVGTISADIAHAPSHGDGFIEFVVKKGQNIVLTETIHVTYQDGTTSKIYFRIRKPDLWYPYSLGSQPLYTVTASIRSTSGQNQHTASRKIGFRKAELIQEPDSAGKSFYFRINNNDIFAGGSNWIPADCFIPRISEERYRKWLTIVREGGQRMIRVWGGGIWEEDIFYDLCDDLGILVWQDFMFSCGNYPTHPEFLDSVKRESVVNIRRLRHHPSVIVYAGNNEDYQVQESFKLTYQYEDKDAQSWLKTDFPARYIYEKLLPEVIAQESSTTPYHPGSPWGDGHVTSDTGVGDLHQWNVWHGTQEKYQLYNELGGRFNSEFGMEALPHINTIKSFCSDNSQLFPQSRLLDFHNKAAGHERRLAIYLMENFKIVADLEGYIYLTQLVQSEAMKFAYQGWRRQWGYNRLCGGALVWQLNDCWPGTSWSLVDYYHRKKPAYYAIKRALRPIAIGVKRTHHDWSVDHARPAKTSKCEVWILSDANRNNSKNGSSSGSGNGSSSKIKCKSETQNSITASVKLRFTSISSGKDIHPPVRKEHVKLVPNGTTDVLEVIIDNTKDEPHVLSATLAIDGKQVSRDTDFPQPLKYLDFSDRGVRVEVLPRGNTKHASNHDYDDDDDDDDDDEIKGNSEVGDEDEDDLGIQRLVVTATKPTKSLVFEERDGVTLSDSGFDVVPCGDDEEQQQQQHVVHVRGLRASGEPLKWRYLGDSGQ